MALRTFLFKFFINFFNIILLGRSLGGIFYKETIKNIRFNLNYFYLKGAKGIFQ